MQRFHEDLTSSANLGTSNFHREHPAKVYKHFQDSGYPKPGGDDFHSPVQPHRYIALRIQPKLHFYARRIPRYNMKKNVLRLVVVLFSVAASALARYKLVALVVVATAASSAPTSWIEFTDMASKAERYTQTVSGLKNLLNWWASLTEVQKASRESIGKLIITSENIITQEQTGWTSIMSKNDSSSINGGGGGGGGGGESKSGIRKAAAVTAGPRVMPVDSQSQ